MYRDLTGDVCLPISFSFNSVGGIQTKTKHDGSSSPAIGERRYLTDEMNA